MPPKKKTRAKRKGKAVSSATRHQLKVLLAALFLLGFLVLSLVFLSQLRETLQPPPPSPQPVGREVLIGGVRVELESVLLRSGASLDRLQAGLEAGRIHFEVRGEFPPPAILSDLARRLRRIAADLRLDARPGAGELSLYRGDVLWALLRFHPLSGAVPNGDDGPKVAIIMDDLGADVGTVRDLLEIDLPVTFSVLPGTANASRVATLAHRRGREVLIHIPMEPRSYPDTDPGRDALLVEHGPAEIRRRFQGYLERIPYAVGGNNHMGSRFTESRNGMATVLAAMQEEDLFFVDSLTTGRSVAFDEARRAGLPAAVRDVFLDNVQEVEQISRQLRRLAAVAASQGTAVGICHPYPQTLEALRRAEPFLRDRGIAVVPVSQLLIR